MLLYDQKRKLVAIDERILEFIGFESLNDLYNRVEDIADLFVNRPGYVYNFKNFSWIDYVLYNPHKTHHAIIETTSGGVEVTITIHSLLNRSGEIAYFCVDLTPEQISEDNDLFVPSGEPPFEGYATPPKKEEIPTDELILEPSIAKTQELAEETPVINFDRTEKLEEPKIDLLDNEEELQLISNEELVNHIDKQRPDFTEEVQPPLAEISPEPSLNETIQEEPKQENLKLIIEEEAQTEAKIYDIDKVSKELEIDSSLLKELVEEFIEQAYAYKEDIEQALNDQDIKQVRQLFHKLRGAATNLRIHQAVEYLKTDKDETIENLESKTTKFYNFMDEFAKSVAPTVLEKIEKEKKEKQAIQNRIQAKNQQPQEENENIPYDMDQEFSIAAAELGIEKEELLSFIKEFIQEAIKQESALFSDLKSGTLEPFKRNIHKLKGTAANLRLHNIEQILKNIMEEDDKEKIAEYLHLFFDNLRTIGKSIGLNVNKLYLASKAQILGLDDESYKSFIAEFLEHLEHLKELNKSDRIKELESMIKIAKQLHLNKIEHDLQIHKSKGDIDDQDIHKLIDSIHSTLNKDRQ